MLYAIVVAGGSGSRMQSATPKQFLPLMGKPVMVHAINTFLQFDERLKVIVVLPENEQGRQKEILSHVSDPHRVQFTNGGQSRFQSVKNGLNCINTEGIVFVHDAVRPMIDQSLLQRCYTLALQKGSAIPVIPCKDSIRQINGLYSQALDRSQLRLVQTPQTFQLSMIQKAFELEEDVQFTDEASVLEKRGTDVFICDGMETNIKITTPMDLKIVEWLMKSSIDSTHPQS
jgi:2-C-methyl-D-erythritol 4-phosphate cytidylyltransferase